MSLDGKIMDGNERWSRTNVIKHGRLANICPYNKYMEYPTHTKFSIVSHFKP